MSPCPRTPNNSSALYTGSTEYDLARKIWSAHRDAAQGLIPNPVNPNVEFLDNSTPAGIRAMEKAMQDTMDTPAP